MDKKQNLYLIRHAQSNYNLAQMVACNSKTEVHGSVEDLNTKFNHDLIDTGISELGREQTKKAAEQVKNVNVKLVISSPLRRCLETTQGVFQDHPNKPKVLVWPAVKELLLSNCDMSDDLDTIKKEFPDYDFSEIDKLPHPQLWLLYTLKNEEVRNKLIEELFASFPTRQEALNNARYWVVDKIKSYYPSHYETQKDLNARTLDVKDSLKPLVEELRGDEAIVVVAHSRFLEAFTSERFEENAEPVNSKWFANCEVAAYNLEQNRIEE